MSGVLYIYCVCVFSVHGMCMYECYLFYLFLCSMCVHMCMHLYVIYVCVCALCMWHVCYMCVVYIYVVYVHMYMGCVCVRERKRERERESYVCVEPENNLRHCSSSKMYHFFQNRVSTALKLTDSAK